MRYTAFILALFAGGVELLGAVLGLGILHSGILFGPGAPGPTNAGVLLALACGVVTILAAITFMLLRDARLAAALVIVCAGVGTLAAGPIFGIGGLLGSVGALVVYRVDRSAPLL